MPLSRVLFLGGLVPLLSALALCALGSVWPFRLDYRALQDLRRVQDAGLPRSAAEVLYLSRDNSMESARIAAFGLRPLAFPDGSLFWATLKEVSRGPWWSGFVAIDAAGNAHEPTSGDEGNWQWRSAPEAQAEAQQRSARGFVVYDCASTRQLFAQRWPFLRDVGRAIVLPEVPSGSSLTWRPIANEYRAPRVLRIAAIVGSCITLALVLLSAVSRCSAWLVVGGSLPLAVGLNMWLAYLLQWILPGAVPWSPAILWVGQLLLAAGIGRVPTHPTWRLSFPTTPTGRIIVCYSLIAYALLFLLRLDFDGDFFTNWLPQARFHYLLGRHEPSAVLSQGSMQAASYPPGYGITLSTLMLAVDMEPTESFLIGPETSFAILMYRLTVFFLNASLLLLLGMYLEQLGTAKRAGWVIGLALTMLLIPSTAGKHIASETLLFPMFGSAIVLIAAGQTFSESTLTMMGLAVGGVATLIKWEAPVLLALGVLPWIASSVSFAPPHRRSWVKFSWVGVLAVSVIPMLVWKMTVDVRNAFFAPVTWSRFIGDITLLPRLIGRALQLTLSDGRLIFLLLALPCAVMLRVRTLPRWSNALVPISIVGLFVGWVVVFLFSNPAPITYLETSYDRLVMVPTFGAILYCGEALQCCAPNAKFDANYGS